MIGRVTHFESRIDRFRPAVRDRWRERAQPGGGLWFDLGPHLVDQALQLFGLPDTVTASFATQRAGALVDDWAHAVLAYGRMRVVLQAAMLVAGGTARFTVHGTDGSLVKRRADQQETQLLAGMRPGDVGWGADADAMVIHDAAGQANVSATPGDQRRFYALVADALLGGGPGPVRPLEALGVMAVIEAAVLSAQEGRSVVPPLTGEEHAAWR